MKILFLWFLLFVGDVSIVKELRGNFFAETPKAQTIEDRIRTRLLECNYDSSTTELFIAQAKFESGNFTNRLTLLHNNPWSMRHPSVRPTTSIGGIARAEGRSGYASYLTIEDAVEDFILYLNHFNYPTSLTADTYVRLLKKKKFFEAPLKQYSRGIKHYL